MELFFLLMPGTGGGSYTLHCPPGSAIESVTRLCRTDNLVTDRHHIVAFIYKIQSTQQIPKYPKLRIFMYIEGFNLMAILPKLRFIVSTSLY
jgi:hypothetical protein